VRAGLARLVSPIHSGVAVDTTNPVSTPTSGAGYSDALNTGSHQHEARTFGGHRTHKPGPGVDPDGMARGATGIVSLIHSQSAPAAPLPAGAHLSRAQDDGGPGPQYGGAKSPTGRADPGMSAVLALL
jgi:hypothetical protein